MFRSLQDHPKGGKLAQTGTLDWNSVGRQRKSATDLGPLDLCSPTLLSPTVFGKVNVAFVAASSSSCHSVAVSTEGKVFGWGRNESGQVRRGKSGRGVSELRAN